ncbi:Pseudopilin GspJ [Planctopirus ephydatiae]|uniref:Type II secretion system protein J n=1 Tax=Planctopirus ephydatiae TaxID=2528019 RepID=A0A518GHZ9_9PLAN|nr:type II secretion system protein GspJ [Planctopirus ephydatiae]QDV28214.1 Pseudopilin GspJ [Planctopirus ephydatiae]
MISRRSCSRRTIGQRVYRQGFNLLEVLLAAALTAVLVMIISQALNTYYRSTVTSRVELERSRLVRAIQRQIASDIRNVTFAFQKEASASSTVSSSTAASTSTSTTSGSSSTSGTETSGTSSGSSSSTTTDETTTTTTSVVGADDQLAAGSAGVVGDIANLKLHVSLPRMETPIFSDVEYYTATTSSDLRQICYYWMAGGSLDNQTGEASQSGLARYEADRLEATFAETSGKALAVPQILAPEIASISFRYFDGLTWLESWDSPTMQALPRAIEVTLQFVPAENRLGTIFNAGVSPMSNQATFVIAVPLADPKPPEETL